MNADFISGIPQNACYGQTTGFFLFLVVIMGILMCIAIEQRKKAQKQLNQLKEKKGRK